MTTTLYRLNVERLKEGCSRNLFGKTDLGRGSLPKEIEIDESQSIHLVQILFILKERFWKLNQWGTFTERNLKSWLYADKSVYLENTPTFGAEFFAELTEKSKEFIKTYCDRSCS
jgi:hypothetical protein